MTCAGAGLALCVAMCQAEEPRAVHQAPPIRFCPPHLLRMESSESLPFCFCLSFFLSFFLGGGSRRKTKVAKGEAAGQSMVSIEPKVCHLVLATIITHPSGVAIAYPDTDLREWV